MTLKLGLIAMVLATSQALAVTERLVCQNKPTKSNGLSLSIYNLDLLDPDGETGTRLARLQIGADNNPTYVCTRSLDKTFAGAELIYCGHKVEDLEKNNGNRIEPVAIMTLSKDKKSLKSFFVEGIKLGTSTDFLCRPNKQLSAELTGDRTTRSK